MDTVGREALFDKLLYYMPFDFNLLKKSLMFRLFLKR